eukprot:Gb_34597 [translate_table: standard]
MCRLREAVMSKHLKAIYTKYGRPMQKNNIVWLDIEVFYIRITACGFEHAPESLTVHYVPRSNLTALEINGRRIRPSASAFLTLRQNGADRNPSEATYVSTDRIRTTGKLCFEVYVRDETLICGTLERRDSASKDAHQQSRQQTWGVDCSCALDYPSRWSSTVKGSDAFPSLEVYVAGRICSLPLVLAHSVLLIPRRKRVRHGVTLDVIPEGNDYENCFNSMDLDGVDYQDEERSLMDLDDRSIALVCDAITQRLTQLFHSKERGYLKCGEGGHLSWLNASVLVGVGFGLGMCLGLGVGVGLLVMRTYQGTKRPLSRFL